MEWVAPIEQPIGTEWIMMVVYQAEQSLLNYISFPKRAALNSHQMIGITRIAGLPVETVPSTSRVWESPREHLVPEGWEGFRK